MKYYTYERADLPKFIGILIFFAWCMAQNAKVTLYIVVGVVVVLLLFYAIFLLIDLDFDRERDAVEADIPFVDSYDEYRQTGVDWRKRPGKPDSSDNPGQLYSTTGKEKPPGYGTKVCQPCAFTGVVTDAERNAFDWPEFKTTKPATR